MRAPALILLLAPLLTGPVALAAEPIVIGAINPLTGSLALQGTSIRQGITLAIEDQNARGGIAGRPITLLSRDDEGKPERALAATEELTGRRGAVALIGGYVDTLVGPISEVADRARVPYLATASLVQPVPLSIHGYAAARALLAALEAAARSGKPLAGDAVRDAVAAVDISTPIGRVKFDDRGDPLFYERVILQIQNDRHVVVYPKDRATAVPSIPAR